jgi:hypothetical protein
MTYIDYFNIAKDKLKELIEKDADIMELTRSVYGADTDNIPRNKYPAITLEADSEVIELATSKTVKMELNINIWFYISLTLQNIDVEKADRTLLKMGACLNSFLTAHEKENGFWITSNWDSIEYGFKETKKMDLIRTGVVRWNGEARIQGGF